MLLFTPRRDMTNISLVPTIGATFRPSGGTRGCSLELLALITSSGTITITNAKSITYDDIYIISSLYHSRLLNFLHPHVASCILMANDRYSEFRSIPNLILRLASLSLRPHTTQLDLFKKVLPLNTSHSDPGEHISPEALSANGFYWTTATQDTPSQEAPCPKAQESLSETPELILTA
jgi:hypothetical protein